MYVFVSRKIKNLQICGSCKSATNIGFATEIYKSHKKYWVRKLQICKLPHMPKVRKCKKLCKPTNVQIFRGLGKDDS